MNFKWKDKRLGAGLIAAVIALTPVALMADDHGDHEDGYRKTATVIRNFEHNQITLPQLIKTAEKAGKGIAIDVELEDDSPVQKYEITLLSGKEVLSVYLSAFNGEVIKVGNPEVIHSAVARITNLYDGLQSKKVSLQEAVSIAEKYEKGVAYQAHIEEMDNWTGYEIDLISNGKQVRIVIDPENGHIVGRKSQDEEDDDES
ncbi:PepSY domain-containing protein [Desulfovibrio sp. JC010]|uniref:PepSY domain-containing protein n=1 Tax=Desulfovibrio sp. JC010 TaxID=2593641 RepID=UPI0013D4226E|nr:PepSY domain-containing protein [Desulfovibrio sp. JC010]NDV28790.1 PepSY domain-containing protein [Desulfovibrio sp. JC010]